MNMLELQLKADEVDRLRAQLREAKSLMIQMDRRYKALKGNEQRLLGRSMNYQYLLDWLGRDCWFRFLLPEWLKEDIKREFRRDAR